MKEKRGFTLLEMIVTVAILFVLLTILMPTMSGFASSANDQISDANLELLNFATHSYASFHEIENRDIFENIDSDQERQQCLVSDGLIEQAVHPTGEGDYCWNITDQKWIRFIDSTAVGCGGEYKPTANPDGSLTPDVVKTPEPTTYPSAKPLPTYIPSAYQKACEASAGKFDIVNEICSCPDGYVLEKEITVDGGKKKVCMTTAEYMCKNSGGKYDLQTKSCLCEGELIANEQGTMCVYDSVAASRKKCVADGGEWIEENGNGYCKYKDDQPFYIDEDNPNFVYAANQLGNTSDPVDFSVLDQIQSLESLKEKREKLEVGSYFYYKGQVYRVHEAVTLSEYDDLDQFVSKNHIFNVSNPYYISGKVYYPNEYVLSNGTWYIPKEKGGVSSLPEEGYSWHSCGQNLEDFNKGNGCNLTAN